MKNGLFFFENSSKILNEDDSNNKSKFNLENDDLQNSFENENENMNWESYFKEEETLKFEKINQPAISLLNNFINPVEIQIQFQIKNENENQNQNQNLFFNNNNNNNNNNKNKRMNCNNWQIESDNFGKNINNFFLNSKVSNEELNILNNNSLSQNNNLDNHYEYKISNLNSNPILYNIINNNNENFSLDPSWKYSISKIK